MEKFVQSVYAYFATSLNIWWIFPFSKIDMDYVKKNVHLENIQYFNHALSKGKGAVVLTAQFRELGIRGNGDCTLRIPVLGGCPSP